MSIIFETATNGKKDKNLVIIYNEKKKEKERQQMVTILLSDPNTINSS